jgi:hypothetical protein
VSEIRLEVGGYPPAKNEAMSMLGAGHSHAPRVRRLLEAAREQADGASLGSGPIALEMTLRCPRDRNRSDATNYLGGVADVLESKGHRGLLEHLGDLALVQLYDNDRQIEEVGYRWQEAREPSYQLCLRSLGC